MRGTVRTSTTRHSHAWKNNFARSARFRTNPPARRPAHAGSHFRRRRATASGHIRQFPGGQRSRTDADLPSACLGRTSPESLAKPFLSMKWSASTAPAHPAARFAALLYDAVSRTRTQINEYPHEKDKSRTGATDQYRRHQGQPLQVGTKHRRRMQARRTARRSSGVTQLALFRQMEDTQNFDLAEPIPGPSTGFFGELARQFGIVLVTSLFERRTAGLYHNYGGGVRHRRLRRRHLPQDAHPRRSGLL